ncbi:MAG TPA: hypothetical protein PLX89_04495 [Verrucomicrobiota bacterium]|nr:hypothetical protein [Verrucomicrobiales bacterium]HRI12245.1 hypothetical protein [Verrucomicrobiota bacterium]
MKRGFGFLLSLGLAITCWLPAQGASSVADDFKKDTSVGVRAAESLSEVTGIAISPLLGVGAIGAYKYYRTKPEDRAGLIWYAQPWFWSVALAIVGVCFLKDSLGPAIPTTLKKPLDVLELFENKLSALIATGAIIPIALEVFEAVKPHVSSQLDLAGAHFASAGLNTLGEIVLVPVALLIYGVVWLVSHTINVLVLISPFTSLDTILKSFRTAVLGSVVGAQALGNGIGAAWALIIVLVCLLLAPWAFRTVVFGTVFACDLITFSRKRFTPSTTSNWLFTARRLGEAPHRAYGRLTRTESGELTFTWRPWLILPARTEKLPPGRYILGRGLIYSEILRVEGEHTPDVFNLPPRCCGHEDALAKIYGLQEIRPIGLRAAWAWFKNLFTARPAMA